MNGRTYYVPWYTGIKSIGVDLDSPEPLTDEAAEALVAERDRLVKEKLWVDEELRLVANRLSMSVESKVRLKRTLEEN